MAQAATGTPSPVPSLPIGQVQVAGRIVHVRGYRTRQGERAASHIIKTPAPDQFTSPGTLEVHAGRKLGDPGDDVSVLCRLTGFGRSYQVTDPETGEKRSIQTADLRLSVID